MGVPFYVDERVIIPRSLIAELLVDESVDPWLSEDDPPRSSTCAQAMAAWRFLLPWRIRTWWWMAPTSAPDALAVAKHQRGQCMSLQDAHHADRIRRTGRPAPARYDLILCNPPYVNAATMAALPARISSAEPALALAGGTRMAWTSFRSLFLNGCRPHERKCCFGAGNRQ